VHNNLWDTNFPSEQGFEMTFRYSVASGVSTSSSSGPVLGMRTAAAFSRPLLAVLARGRVAGEPPGSVSWLTLDDDRVRVVGLTTPQPGQILVRLQSVADAPLNVRIRTSWPVERAQQATFLGHPLRDVQAVPQIDVPMNPFGISAVLLTLGDRSTG
jgi:hypothetical protein